ncbi:MAG: Unknown protein, partial [uncultured Sulfurovum sp.]
ASAAFDLTAEWCKEVGFEQMLDSPDTITA